jgi:molecular chaperone HscB
MQNLFDILSLPAAFALNLKTLEQAYFAAQRQWHPDRFVGKPVEARAQAAQRSVLINDAYETLKNPLERAKHLLELRGVFIDDETNPPPALLMEIMELRERIHDAGGDGRALLALVDEIKQLAGDCTRDLGAAFDAADMAAAQAQTLRMGYLGKAMEDAHMLLYRLKAQQEHHH